MRGERGQYQPEQADRQTVFIRASREQSGLMKGKRGSVRTQERNKGPAEMERDHRGEDTKHTRRGWWHRARRKDNAGPWL